MIRTDCSAAFSMTSLGITLTSFKEEVVNPYVHEKIYMKHFFTRKWLLVRYSVGFIVFPGGFGTLDELFEIVTLEKTYKMPKLPIILMDNRFWEPVMDWLKTRPLKQGLINQKDVELVSVTSDVQEAFEIIEKYCKDCKVKRPLYTR